MTTKMFGQRVPRVEDPRLLSGQGRFLDDLGHDALAVAFVRSPHAHARIVDIDVSAALGVEGLVAIFTYDDLDGRTSEPLPLLIPHPTLTHGRTPHALANDEVNHVGEAIVMVVAVDRYVAEDVVGLIDVQLRVPSCRRRRCPGTRRHRPSARRRTRQRLGEHGAGGGRRPGHD